MDEWSVRSGPHSLGSPAAILRCLPPVAFILPNPGVDLTRCETIQPGIRPFFVVIAHPETNLSLGVSEVLGGVQINAFVFQRPPQALDEHVVSPLALPSMEVQMPCDLSMPVKAALVNWVPWSALKIFGRP